MAADPVKDPPGVLLTADNWFHEGWLFAALGLPRRAFNDPDNPVRDVDIDIWNEGYDTAVESEFELTVVFGKMTGRGQIVAEPMHR